MVLENIVVYLLDKYLGDYIENLDTKKFKIDLWTGNVVLQNLYLKSNALADLNLPVTISIGYLQKLTLQVPWKNLYTYPTKVTIDGLFLLVVPKTEVQYDAKRDEREHHESKMKEVRKVEELRKQKEAEKNKKENDKNNDTFVERMQLQILRNLELSIRNVHVVYEDKTTKPNHPFAFGITLNYITLHTTTADWEPTILKEDTSLIHKLGELSALSIYWNTYTQSRSDLPRDDIINHLRERIAIDNEKVPSDISYILRPLNVKAKLILAIKPRQENFQRPMFDIKIDLDAISLNVNQNQYSDLLDLLEFQDYLSLQSKYIKYQIKDDTETKLSVKRWKFAYEAILNEEIRRKSECYKWENIKAHLDRCREYRSIHLQQLIGKLTKEQNQRAIELEKKLDVFNLTFIRRSVEIEVKKKKHQEVPTWWGSISNWWSGNKAPGDPELDLEQVMPPEEQKKLYDAIGYEGEDTTTSTYPEAYIDIDLAIRLNMLDVNIWSKVNENDTDCRVIARGVIPDTNVVFKRRPANDAIGFFVDLGSFQVFGIATDPKQSEFLNNSRPILVKPSAPSDVHQKKLLKIEFETKPLDKQSDYRLKVLSESLEIKYNAPTINKLAECFEPDSHRNLQGFKQVAYSTYTDVKHRSYILMKHNIEKIKVLDIFIDLQSSYFLLPENGIYNDNCAAICMDLGHLTLKRNDNENQIEGRSSLPREAKDIKDARELSYTQFKLKLEDIQLIYAHRNESWEQARKEKNSHYHLIKPMELEMNVDKCIYNDDAVLPAWKVAGNIPNIELRLSDKRLFHLINHVQSVPFPESKSSIDDGFLLEAETATIPFLLSNPEETYETVEGLTPVKKELEYADANEDFKERTDEKQNDVEGQRTQLVAIFTLARIDLHINQALNEFDANDDGVAFLHLSLESINAQTKIKTFDMEFDASLTNLILYHKQFVGHDGQHLRLLSAQLNKSSHNGINQQIQKLVSIHFLHTSPENPLFLSATYHGIENNAYVHFTKLVVTLQLEALLSILRFEDGLSRKLSSHTPQPAVIEKKTPEILKVLEQNVNYIIPSSTFGNVAKRNDITTTPTLKVKADLEEFQVIITSKVIHLFDIQVQGVQGNVSQAPEATVVSLILSDLRVVDPHEDARYRKIISQQVDQKELLRVNVSLFNYDEGYEKPIDVCDCHVKINFAKANIIFLFKHIDAILNFLDSLNITKAALDLASAQADAAYEQVQKLQEQAFKVHLDVTFNAPNIIIPTNSYSDEALLLDLGRLIINTGFYDDPKRSLIEQQHVRFENILASRVKLNPENNILGEIILLECAELNTLVNRLLYPEKFIREPSISVKIEWESVHFRLAKDDYTCIMKVLMENFIETMGNQMVATDKLEYYHYREEEREKEEDALRNAALKKQHDIYGDEVLQTMKVRAEIKKLALTLYLGESPLNAGRAARDENLKLANVEIEMLEALFRQNSDLSYKAMIRVKNFLLDDLREKNPSTSVTRIMDKHFTVDPKTHMFVGVFEFKPKSSSYPFALRQLSAQLESLYICISLDYLMELQDFFISGLPSSNNNSNIPKPSISTNLDVLDNDKNRLCPNENLSRMASKRPSVASIARHSRSPSPLPSNSYTEIETRVDLVVKNPEIIILEGQHNVNSNCLVLDVALQVRMISIGEDTKIYCWLKDLTIYSSNFAELRNPENSSSKIKYRILHPAKADIIIIMDGQQEKIDVRISNIIVSIAPAAVRTLISVTNSLGTLQTTAQENEVVDVKTLFEPQPFNDSKFWFTKDNEQRDQDLDKFDILETVTGVPSENKKAKEEEKKEIQQLEKLETKKPLLQQLILTLETIELKLEVDLGSVTKSLVAMCLSNLTADVKNWSTNLTVASAVNIEAALFNERMLAWEPLIEPTIDPNGVVLSPWCITCSVLPAVPHLKSGASIVSEEVNGALLSENSKYIIYIRADQLLNITITKTGIDLIQRLSVLFNDVYNQRLPSIDDDNSKPVLTLSNKTGKEFLIENLYGVEFAKNTKSISKLLKQNESISLLVPYERQPGTRLSVIEELDTRKRQEFSLKIGDIVKTININHTCKRIYDWGISKNLNWPLQILCDGQLQNNRRHLIFSSIVKIYNNTTLELIVLSINTLERHDYKKVAKILPNEEYYVPMDIIYEHTSSLIFIGNEDARDPNGQIIDFFSFNWERQSVEDRKLKSKDGSETFFVVSKESNMAYVENTDQLERTSFSVYIHLALHLTNLLPVDIKCQVDGIKDIDLKSSETHLATFGNKHSILKFTIPFYANQHWVSETVDLSNRPKEDYSEFMVLFYTEDPDHSQTLRLVLHVDTFHESYRLSLYAPFWVVNRTDLKLEFQIENQNTMIEIDETPFLVCPEKFQAEINKKGLIRLKTNDTENNTSNWSEKFSLDVIKSTGMASCSVLNDRVYMICVDIVTSSFGLTKIITLSPSVVILNKSAIEIELVETVSEQEQDKWLPVNPDKVIPFWPHDIKEGVIRIRYTDNRITSHPFKMNQKHRTLLRMDDEERPALYVEVSATEFDGIRVIFGGYRIGDAPLLVVNCLSDEPVSFSQADDVRTQILRPKHYVYYTWFDPLKPRALSVSCGSKAATLELSPHCGYLTKDGEDHHVKYALFLDGIQTVLLFSDDVKIIEAATEIPSLVESMGQRIQIGIHDIGLSIINDRIGEEMVYISFNKSKVIWTETKRSRVRPLPDVMNAQLEEFYKTHTELCEAFPEDEEMRNKKYKFEEYPEVTFHDGLAELINAKGRRKIAKRQALDGFWVEYAWSITDAALHLRINRVQIDNQLDYSVFPVILYPIISKAAGTELSDKPFIELSVYESKKNRSNVVHFKYFKLLVQEFAVNIDQGFIVAVLAFFQQEKVLVAPKINMNTDLAQIQRHLSDIVKAQTDIPSNETELFFDIIHLSPLKIHVSFSMYGSKPTEELLAEYPIAHFLLQTLNVAEVQDVVLRLGFYEQTNDRYTITRLTNEVSSHYQNQFMKQVHVLVFGLDVLGNPLGVIRGLAEGVESFFYEPYKGAIVGPLEFAEGVITGVRTLFGSAVGGAAGAFSKITGVLGKGLASLTFDEDYKTSRIRRRDPVAGTKTDIAVGGKNVVMGFVDGVKGVVSKPVSGAKHGGTSGFVKGLGKGMIGLVTRPTGGIVDFTSTSLEIIKRTAQQEELVHRVRYPRHVGHDGLIRPYIAHEAIGFFILNRLEDGKYAKSDTYVAHITCTQEPPSWLMATSKRILFVTEISFLGLYEVDWEIAYESLKEEPSIKPNLGQIQILTREPTKTGTFRSTLSYGKMVKYRNTPEARYIVEKITNAMHTAGL